MIIEKKLLKEPIFNCIQTFYDSISLILVGDIKNKQEPSFSSLQGFLADHIRPLHQNFNVARMEEILNSTDFEHPFDETTEKVKIIKIY